MVIMTTYTQIAAFVAEGKTPDEIAVLLREQNVRVDNNQAWTLGLIETELGEDTAMTLAGVIQQASQTNPLMASAFTAMSTTGIELYSDSRQAMIETIGTAAGMTADQIAQVKALGVTYQAIDPDATPESVQALINAESVASDETRHEVLMSVNRSTSGEVRIIARVTAVEFLDGQPLRRGVTQSVNTPELTAAIEAIVGGLV
jgi:hypothetical protein